MGIIRQFIAKGFLSAVLLTAVWLPAYAQKNILTAETFDGILSGMTVNDKSSTHDAEFFSSVADLMNIGKSAKVNAPTPKKQHFSRPNRTTEAGVNMVLPVEGNVTSGFGYRPAFGRVHKGIDLKLQVGDTVRSALAGVVERVAVDPQGYGLFVVIRHGGDLETRYGHLSRSLVVTGHHVEAGEAIALGGSTGNSTGSHLHFETRQGGEAFDPAYIFNFAKPAWAAPNKSLARIDETDRQISGDIFSLVGLVTAGKVKASHQPGSEQVKTTYVVKAGDTVGTVASKAGISVLTLCRLNMLSSNDALKPGTMLRLR